MKKQVIVIHGADSFDSYDRYIEALKNWEVTIETFMPWKPKWKNNLQKNLGDDFEVLAPRMPNGNNAQYIEWKIWFEKMIPFIKDDVILLGHSQGGIFLVKYLSENKLPRKIKRLILVAPPHTDSSEIGSFAITNSLDLVSEQCDDIHIHQSEDDDIVPYREVEYYKKDIPKVKIHTYKDRGHFLQEEFPELIDEIKNN